MRERDVIREREKKRDISCKMNNLPNMSYFSTSMMFRDSVYVLEGACGNKI